MTRSRYRIFETEYPYFLTCMVVGWVPVFTRLRLEGRAHCTHTRAGR